MSDFATDIIMRIFALISIPSLVANAIKYTELLNKIYDFADKVKTQRKVYYQTAFDDGGYRDLHKVSAGGHYTIITKLQSMKEWLENHRSYNELFKTIGVCNLTDNIQWVNIDYFEKCSAFFSKNWLLSYRLKKLSRMMRKIFVSSKEPKLNKTSKQELSVLIGKILHSLEKIRVKYNLDKHVLQ